MNYLKRMGAWMLVCLLFICAAPVSVFANPCCWFEIKEVTQTDAGLVVSYSSSSDLASRNFSIRLRHEDANGNTISVLWYESNVAIPSVDQGTYTIPADEYTLVSGFTYSVFMYTNDTCDNDYCDGNYDSYEFVVTDGTPHLAVKDMNLDTLTPIGAGETALSLTVPQDGFYTLQISGSTIRAYTMKNHVIRDDNTYYKGGATLYCMVKAQNGGEIVSVTRTEGNNLTFSVQYEDESKPQTVTLSFQQTVPEKTTVKENPTGGDTFFSLKDVYGLTSFTVTKEGVYRFAVTAENNEAAFGDYNIYKTDGTLLFNSPCSTVTEEVFYPGTYYLDTSYIYIYIYIYIREDTPSSYTISVTYVELKTLTYGTTYTLEKNTAKYYLLTVTQPVYFSYEGTISSLSLRYGPDDGYSYYLYKNDYRDNASCVLQSGTYYVKASASYDGEGETDTFTPSATLFESMQLDTPTTPDTLYNRDGHSYYYLAFCAPEAGQYEFDFSKCTSTYNYSAVGEEYGSIRRNFVLRDMKKDEWILLLLKYAETISVTKYQESAATALTYDTAATYPNYSGRTYVFSFTPTEDGDYKFLSESCASTSTKIYTADAVLYEENSKALFNLSKTVTLKKNVPVYISFYNNGNIESYAEAFDIKVTSPYIESNAIVEVTTTDATIAYYKVPQAGYYQVSLKKSYDYSYNRLEVSVNGIARYVNKYSYTTVLTWADADEAIEIKAEPYEGSSSCNLTISIEPIMVEALTENTAATITVGSYYSFTPETDGLYAITGTDITSSSSGGSGETTINLSVSGGGSDYLSCAVGNAAYFEGKAGTSYLIQSYNQNMTATITKATTTPMAENTSYTVSGGDTKIYALTISAAGLYRFNVSKCCNTELMFRDEDESWMYASRNHQVYRLQSGTYYLIARSVGIGLEGD